MSKKLWVKFQSFNPTRVSTEDCEIVDDFIRACKKELQIINPPQELNLSTTVGGTSIRPGLKLSELFTLDGYTVNDDEYPLYIGIIDQLEETSESKQLILFFRESSIFSHWFH